MEIIKYKEAKKKGFNKYFTGEPCVNGHVDYRYVCSRGCKECQRTKGISWRKANPERSKKTRDAWIENNPEINRKYQGLPEPTRIYPETGQCEICGLPESSKHQCGTINRLSLDHDHKTGQFRGWLCSRCNHGIGNFKDSAENLRRATSYLEGMPRNRTETTPESPVGQVWGQTTSGEAFDA